MQLLRRPAKPGKRRQNTVRNATIGAPVAGWDAKSPLASMPPLAAVQLKNFFPQPGWVEVRRGIGYHSRDIGSLVKTVSAVNTGTDTFTSNSHGNADGTLVKFHSTDALPTGLALTISYYVIDSSTNTFKVSRSPGGSAVDITTSGAGTLSVYVLTEPVVETLALWQGPASSKMIAGSGGSLWDVTVAGAATLARAGTAQTDRWQWCNHTTSVGHYLFMVNGADAPLHYDGISWAEPSITGVTASEIVHVNAHKKRLWFTIKNSTTAAYLATEAVAGAASTFEMGGVFARGGYLMATATWTRDGGAGSDDYFVAISSRGQAALYQGTDPSSADTWELVGVFDVPPPIGRRCFHRYGADLLLVTLEGVFPLSQLLAVDQSQVSRVAITDLIAPEFASAARSYSGNHGWEIAAYPKGTRLIVNVPTAESSTAKQYVMNTISGAWCEYDSHNALCWSTYNDLVYYGGPDGKVYLADTGSTDLGSPITATGQAAYSAFGTANVKRFSMIRPLVTVTGNNRPSVGVSTDFVETTNLSALPSGTSGFGAVWDSAEWDVSSWSSSSSEVNDWANAAALGTFASIKFSAQTGTNSVAGGWSVGTWGSQLWGGLNSSDETMRIQGFLLLYEPGEYI